MSDTIRIGTWQGPITEGDFDANLARVRGVAERARAGGLDFLCLPETYLTGYAATSIREGAVTLEDPRLVGFIRESAAHDTVILVGVAERLGETRFNSQLVIHRGRLLGMHRKSILTGHDRKYFTPDLKMPVFTAKGITFGVVICHETSFVEPALCLRWKGARLIFTPHYDADLSPWGWGDTPLWEHRTNVLNNQAGLATLLKVVVVRSDVVSADKDRLGFGDAGIWNMNGVPVAVGTPLTECLVTAEFPRSIFAQEHWIDRREVPLELLTMIVEAAQRYPRG